MEPTKNYAFKVFTAVAAGVAVGPLIGFATIQSPSLWIAAWGAGGGSIFGLFGYLFYATWPAFQNWRGNQGRFESLADAFETLRRDILRARAIRFVGRLSPELLKLLMEELRRRPDKLGLQITNDGLEVYRNGNGSSSDIADLLRMDRERESVRHMFSYSRQLISQLELEVGSSVIVYLWRSQQQSSAFRYERWTDARLIDSNWQEVHPVSLNNHAEMLTHNRTLLDKILEPNRQGWSHPIFPSIEDERVKNIWQSEILRWWAQTGAELLTRCQIRQVKITWYLTEHSLKDAEDVKAWLEKLQRSDGPAVTRYVYVDCKRYELEPAYRSVVDKIVREYLEPAQRHRGSRYTINYLNFDDVPLYLRDDLALMEGDAPFVQKSDRKAIEGLMRVTITADRESVRTTRDLFEEFNHVRMVPRLEELCGPQNYRAPVGK